MKTSRLILAMFLTIVITCLVGCGNNSSSTEAQGTEQTVNNSEVDASADPEKVVIAVMTTSTPPEDCSAVENVINSYIAENYPDANVEIGLKVYASEDYQTKVNLALQSGTQLDLFIPIGFQNYIANNQCLAIDSLLEDYGQEMTSIITEDNGSEAFAPFKKDGVTYGVPVNRVNVLTPVLIYDADMLEAAGYTEADMTSISAMTPIFEKIKELYPDIYCFSGISAQDSGIMEFLQHDCQMDYLSDSAIYAGAYLGVAFGDDPTVVNLFETDQFKAYASLVREWYNNGYLPLDMATSYTSGVELLNSGKVFCCSTVSSGTPEVNAAMLAFLTGRNIHMVYMSDGYHTTADTGYAYAISSNCEVPEAAMILLNIIYTDEFVYNSILYGVEGEDYVLTDDGHWTYPDGKDAYTVSYSCAYSYGLIGSEKLAYPQMGNTKEEVMIRINQNVETDKSPFYGFVFDPSNVTDEMTALQNVYSQYMPGLICGSVDTESTLDAFNSALKSAGIDKVIGEKQAQLDEWLAQNK